MKTMTKKEMAFYFNGGYDYVSNKYFTFKHVIDDDNNIITTSNIKFIKGNPVMIVGNNKGLYLKNWQINVVFNSSVEGQIYTVKLNRKFFRPYQFNFTFDDMSFAKDDTFDELLKIAREQDEVQMRWTVELK